MEGQKIRGRGFAYEEQKSDPDPQSHPDTHPSEKSDPDPQ